MIEDADAIRFTRLDGARDELVEFQWIAPERHDRPLVVFLHEGLGSVAMWKDFPRTLCDAAQVRGLVHSRAGYGRSTPPAAEAPWDVDYLHRQAYEALPSFFSRVGVDATSGPVWLLGHSDGASIALLFAARFPDAVAGLVLLAPHLFVEPLSVQGIEAARDAYLHDDLRERLARHHDNVDVVFWRWNRIWLDARFRSFNIEAEAARVACPVLVIQGYEDQYGTLEQVRALERHAPQTQVRLLEACRHSPHRDQPEQLIEQVVAFLDRASIPARLR